jgi:hypothetical protein
MSSWRPTSAFTAPSATWSSPSSPRLTQEQAEVLAIVISDGMATRRRIEEVRGAAQLSIGSDGPVSLLRDSSETLALLLSRGLLCAERDDHATGRPLVYRPTPRLLELLGVETLDEARGRLGVPAHTHPAREPTRECRVMDQGSRAQAGEAVGALAEAASQEDETTAHVLRHTFGTTLVRGGADLVLVAELMGHARLETTRANSRPTAEDRAKALDLLPVDR